MASFVLFSVFLGLSFTELLFYCDIYRTLGCKSKIKELSAIGDNACHLSNQGLNPSDIKVYCNETFWRVRRWNIAGFGCSGEPTNDFSGTIGKCSNSIPGGYGYICSCQNVNLPTATPPPAPVASKRLYCDAFRAQNCTRKFTSLLANANGVCQRKPGGGSYIATCIGQTWQYTNYDQDCGNEYSRIGGIIGQCSHSIEGGYGYICSCN